MDQAIVEQAFKALSGILEVRSISVPTEELWHPAMAIEEQKEADDGASNAAVMQIRLVRQHLGMDLLKGRGVSLRASVMQVDIVRQFLLYIILFE